MEENIVINILPATNVDTLISIMATLTSFTDNGRNALFECEINSINPATSNIPENSAEAGVVNITFNNGKRSFRDWKIRLNGSNLVLKTYPNPVNMRLDNGF